MRMGSRLFKIMFVRMGMFLEPGLLAFAYLNFDLLLLGITLFLEPGLIGLCTPECSGTGSGFEILYQGFNWESHKTGRWYQELQEKATELASLGFTVVWLPTPTESISPEGYMPKDLYNLNSRYG